MTIIHSVESIMTIIIMFMAGYFMTRAGWLDNKAGDMFARIILNVSLPSYMIWNIMSTFDRERLQELSGGLVVPVITIGSMYVLSIAASKLLRVKEERVGIFRTVFFTSNTIFIGLPVNLALFGEQSVTYVLLYYIVNTSFFWTLGVYGIGKSGMDGTESRFFSKNTAKKVLSPALVGFMMAIVLILAGVRLPMFIMDSCKYIGQLTTPLAMLFTGIVLHSVRIRDIKIDRDIIVLVLARFVICPLTVMLLVSLFNVPSLMGKVFVIQAAMPAMSSIGAIAKAYNSDYEFGTIAIVITTVLSMVAIPIYMLLI